MKIMNCKQGDLAIIVKSTAGNEGKIVKCVKFLGADHLLDPKFGDAWEIDIVLPTISGFTTKEFYDAWLRPIRDSDKEDEMLRIVNLTEKV